MVAAIRADLGLDRPLHVQYLGYLGDALRGDFGTSWKYRQPALEMILARMPATPAEQPAAPEAVQASPYPAAHSGGAE